MNDAMLKTILRTTDEFAVHPSPVTQPLPWAVTNANRQKNLRACPRGLTHARVFENGAAWEEESEFACGDQVYKIPRKNGVKIVFEPENINDYKGYPYTRRLTRGDGAKMIEMIVPRGAVLAPWSEYAMIEAERQKERDAQEARRNRLESVVDAIGGGVPSKSGWYPVLVGPKKNRREVLEGRVTITIERAEEIIEALNLNKSGGSA